MLGGEYRLIEEIGWGAAGTVFRAQHLKTRQLYAMKVLRPELKAEESVISRFEAEYKAVQIVNHPNIVRVYDMGALEDGRPFILMELMDKSLEATIASDGALPFWRAIAIAQQVADALTFVHEMGIIHNDLKTENLLLRRELGQDNIAKISDFGISRFREVVLAKARAKVTEGGFLIGTFNCMAPEQFMAEPPSERSDIWALGVTLYIMLTGENPFSGESPMKTMFNICNRNAVAPHKRRPDLNIPKALSPVVSKALAKAPRDRFQNAVEFKSALGSLL